MPSQLLKNTGGRRRVSYGVSPEFSHTANQISSGCRDFIIHMLESVPRNFNYQDGMRLIHRTLEIAFGDENGHLATGVLEELIEIEGFPPFPESIFQRWKYAYRNRNVRVSLATTLVFPLLCCGGHLAVANPFS